MPKLRPTPFTKNLRSPRLCTEQLSKNLRLYAS